MAIIKFNRKDLCRLVGKELPMTYLEARLPMLGVGIENVDKEEIEAEVYPNRPDMLSVEGVARALSSFIKYRKGLKKYTVNKSNYEVSVDRSTNIRPFIACAVIKDVDLSDELVASLMQLQEKLHATHCRKRAKASIGIYDLDSITWPVFYTTKEKDFMFIPLEFKNKMDLNEILRMHQKGKDYGWIIERFEKYPVLIDSKEMVLSMPPIINSEDSKVKSETRNLFIDVTGTDRKTVNEVLNIVVSAVGDRGGKLFSVKIKSYLEKSITPDLNPKKMKYDSKYINKILGLELSDKQIGGLLEFMGFSAKGRDAFVPAYRTDIMHQIDLAEDVAIAFGYDQFEPEIPEISTVAEEDSMEKFSNKFRNIMVGMGFQEIMTFIMTNRNKQFKKMNMPDEEIAETSNPKSAEYSACRKWLLPGLLETLAFNKTKEFPQKIFEVGDKIEIEDGEAKNVRKIAGVISHDSANLTEIKSALESVLRNAGINYSIKEYNHPSFVPSRCAEIIINDESIGFFGEIHPGVLKNWGIENPVIAFEISLGRLHS